MKCKSNINSSSTSSNHLQDSLRVSSTKFYNFIKHIYFFLLSASWCNFVLNRQILLSNQAEVCRNVQNVPSHHTLLNPFLFFYMAAELEKAGAWR